MDQPQDDRPAFEALHALLIAREEGTLDEQGHAQLEQLVIEDPRAREIFTNHLLQTVSLRA